ncbi:MAG: deoxyhypusine synthase family protein [Dehalococcoidia bacterium]|nr:deoxyhypusine synthase family protein [Dehalococcoidia bacterium]
MSELRHTRVVPFPITDRATAAELMERMAGTSFQARHLAAATDIWARMLADPEATVFLGVAGALVPAGMRPVLSYLVEHRMVDCIVSTGANLFHDLYETLGSPHWQHPHETDDVALGRLRFNRFYDVLAPETDFSASEEFVVRFIRTLDSDRPYTTREFFAALGQALLPAAKEEGILTAAARRGVPVYSAALGDSMYGLALANARMRYGHAVQFDIVADVLETTQLVTHAGKSAVVYLGGGTPKNFIQQAAAASYVLGREVPGHSYGIQITMDQPQWGGLSGCTFEEAQSWRKIAPEADFVTVNVEVTVALPLIVSALAESHADVIARREPPPLSFEGTVAAGGDGRRSRS